MRNSWIGNLGALLLCLALLGGAGQAAAQGQVLAPYPYDEGDRPPSVGKRILMYPFHRIADLLDIAQFNLGFGLGLHVNAHATRALQLGFGAATTSKIGGTGAMREYGLYQEIRAEFSLLLLSLERLTHNTTGIGSVRDYSTSTEPDRLYLIKRDYAGVGADVTAGIVAFGFEFHPLEIFDFLLGIFTIDPMGDDV